MGLLFSGCASTSVFKNYPAQTSNVRKALEAEDSDKAYDLLSKKVKCADKILYLQERGRVASLQKDYQASIADWDQAYSWIETNRMKATVSASKLASQAASLAVNDNAIPYQGYSYELVFLHTFQAFNYLGLNNLSGAMVELRRAGNEQAYAREQHHKELTKAKKDTQKSPIDPTDFETSLNQGYKEMSDVTSKVKSSFQNPYTFCLSAILHEITGDRDNAYVAYKQALELTPENTYLKEATLRLAKSLQRTDDLHTLEKRYGSHAPSTHKRGQGRLVVFYESGWIPQKEQIKLPVFFNQRSYTIAMPYYSAPWTTTPSLSIKAPKKSLGQTETLCSPYALASKALSEDYPKILIRQILRIIAKDQFQKYIQKQEGEQQNKGFISLITSAASLLSENADRRSWLTLPNKVQFADFMLPEGTYKLDFKSMNTQLETHSIQIQEGKTCIVRVICINRKLWIDTFDPN